MLDVHGRDGLDFDIDRVGHVELQALSGDEVRLAGLAGELVAERDALRFRGDDVVELRALLQKFFGGSDRHLYIAKDDETGNVEVRVDFADGQLTGQARDVQFIVFTFCHSSYSPLK